MRKWLAAAATGLIIVGLLFAVAMQSVGKAGSDTPERCLEQMFQAMKDGDVAVYLACFGGELRERLQRTVQDQTREKFSEYLKELVAPVKGRAVLQDNGESSGPDHIRLVVDRVYERRPWEYQAYRLRRDSGAWKIYEIEPPVLHEPPVPYGTPAYPTAEKSEQPRESESPRP